MYKTVLLNRFKLYNNLVVYNLNYKMAAFSSVSPQQTHYSTPFQM